MTYEILFGGTASLPGGEDEITGFLDRVMENLIARGTENPGIGGAMAAGDVEVSLTVDAENLQAALNKATEIISQTLAAASSGNVSPIEWERLEARRAAAVPA